MFGVILLTSVLSVVLAGETSDDACNSLMMTPGIECAKVTFIPNMRFGQNPHTDDLKECNPLQHKSKSCEFNTCVAKKNGFLSADGTVDKKTLSETLDKQFDSNPQLLDNLKVKCINGDLTKYEKDDIARCDILKIQYCIQMQVLKSIDLWDDEGKCKGVKKLKEECVKQFD